MGNIGRQLPWAEWKSLTATEDGLLNLEGLYGFTSKLRRPSSVAVRLLHSALGTNTQDLKTLTS
ncbi:hypothetical protein CRUP_030787 [Coryphaenoides rupestris]|nr:hypothetical protein CRUP_030787 [Coryphaenoides rupestris]